MPITHISMCRDQSLLLGESRHIKTLKKSLNIKYVAYRTGNIGICEIKFLKLITQHLQDHSLLVFEIFQ